MCKKIFICIICIAIGFLLISCSQAANKATDSNITDESSNSLPQETPKPLEETNTFEKIKITYLNSQEIPEYKKEFVSISEFKDFNYKLLAVPFQQHIVNSEYNEPIIIDSQTQSFKDGAQNYSNMLKALTGEDMQAYLNTAQDTKQLKEYKYLWYKNHENIIQISPDGTKIVTEFIKEQEQGKFYCDWLKIYVNNQYVRELKEGSYLKNGGLVTEYSSTGMIIENCWTDTLIFSNDVQIHIDAINEQGTIFAYISKDNDTPQEGYRVKVYSIDGPKKYSELYDFYGILNYGKDVQLVEAHQIIGDAESGIILFTNGLGQVFTLEYPSGKATLVSNYAFLPSLSPDKKYLAYTSPDYLTDFRNFDEDGNHIIDTGIYIKELETGKTAFIPLGYYETPLRCDYSWFME